MTCRRFIIERIEFRKGFTLLELLVVVSIVAILVGLMLPAVQMARESARRTQCLNSARQIAIGVLSFESSRNVLPTGMVSGAASKYRYRTWLQEVLSFVERDDILEQAELDYNFSPNPFVQHVGLQTVVSTFQCPSDPSSGSAHVTHGGLLVAHTAYLGVAGTNRTTQDGVFFINSRVRSRDIRDGLSNTLLFGERPASRDFWYGWWYAGLGQEGTGSGDMLLGVRETLAPNQSYLDNCPVGPVGFQRGNSQMCDVLHYWSFHPGGAVFSLCDGSVRFLPYTADSVLVPLSTRSGQEVFTQLEGE